MPEWLVSHHLCCFSFSYSARRKVFKPLKFNSYANIVFNSYANIVYLLLWRDPKQLLIDWLYEFAGESSSGYHRAIDWQAIDISNVFKCYSCFPGWEME